MDQATEQTLQVALDAAPAYVRDFIGSGKYTTFIDKLRILGDFHVDTLGIISNELLMMLLGITEPRELPEALVQQAKITEGEAALVIDLANDEIFGPLRTAAQGEPRTPTQPPLVPPPAVGMSVPSSIPGYPPDPTRPTTPAPVTAAPNPVPPPLSVPPPAPVPIPPPVVAPLPTPSPILTPATPPVSVFVPAPTMRTMAHDIETMQEGGAPSHAPLQPVVPATPRMAPEPQPLPQPAPRPVIATPSATPPSTPTPSAQEVHETLKQYGIDPYREPVE